MDKHLIHLMDLLKKYNKPGGQFVAWVSAFTPVELIRSFDVDLYFPENTAAALSKKGKSPELIARSSSKKLSSFVCSYATIFQGLLEKDNDIRPPDFLIATNNQCLVTFNWWKLLALHYNKPLFLLDLSGSDEEIYQNFKELILFLEKHTNNKLDMNDLKNRIQISKETTQIYKRILDLRIEKSVPADFFVNSLTPIVLMKSEIITLNYYKELETYINKTYDIRENKINIVWVGYPQYYLEKYYPEILCDKIVYDTYTYWWILKYQDYDDPIMILAHTYRNTPLNVSYDYDLDQINKLSSKIKIDGIVIMNNKSCQR